ncbi:hypothetical protein J4E05_12250 [Thalassospira sp. NFXS8]|uniref:hypothetical protein n=1 Tax=Thalassospira sp. NFXS8 TaxID=2819093 RepID=UPI0032DFE2F0
MMRTEYDDRQIKRMKDQVINYKNGAIGLGDLVEDLIFLRDALDVCPSEWDHKFTEKLTDLESVNSYLIEKNENKLDQVTQPIVNGAIQKIEYLISEL